MIGMGCYVPFVPYSSTIISKYVPYQIPAKFVHVRNFFFLSPLQLSHFDIKMAQIDTFNYCSKREQSLIDILSSYNVQNDKLTKAIGALGEATTHCATILSNYVSHESAYAGTQNASGDDQLHLDIQCDNAVFSALKRSSVCAIAASEETPVETSVGDTSDMSTFAIGFDPLDGSSIIDANFSVGSIYGIWPRSQDKPGVLQRTGREQLASAMALYGPRTTLCIALPSQTRNNEDSIVLEVTLVQDRSIWSLSRKNITLLKDGKYFAPGNLRASNDNERYASLIQNWMQQRYTLRYSGGMVPGKYLFNWFFVVIL